jgi:hypothetical protein
VRKRIRYLVAAALLLHGCALYPQTDDRGATRVAKVATRVVLGVGTIGLSELFMYWGTHPGTMQRDLEEFQRTQPPPPRQTRCETRCVNQRDVFGNVVTNCREYCREY